MGLTTPTKLCRMDSGASILVSFLGYCIFVSYKRFLKQQIFKKNYTYCQGKAVKHLNFVRRKSDD